MKCNFLLTAPIIVVKTNKAISIELNLGRMSQMAEKATN